MPTTRSRGLRAGGALAVLVAAIAASVALPGAGGVSAERPAPRSFFDQFNYAAFAETQLYDTLRDAKKDATVIVRGPITGVGVTRTVGDLAAGGVQYVGVRIRPDEVLAGRLPAEHRGELTVEFMTFGGDPVAPDEDVAQDGIWILRNKADFRGYSMLNGAPAVDESAYYRLVSSQGLFIQGADRVENPLRRDEHGREAVLPGDKPAATVHRPDAVDEGQQFRRLDDLEVPLRK